MTWFYSPHGSWKKYVLHAADLSEDSIQPPHIVLLPSESSAFIADLNRVDVDSIALEHKQCSICEDTFGGPSTHADGDSTAIEKTCCNRLACTQRQIEALQIDHFEEFVQIAKRAALLESNQNLPSLKSV